MAVGSEGNESGASEASCGESSGLLMVILRLRSFFYFCEQGNMRSEWASIGALK